MFIGSFQEDFYVRIWSWQAEGPTVLLMCAELYSGRVLQPPWDLLASRRHAGLLNSVLQLLSIGALLDNT